MSQPVRVVFMGTPNYAVPSLAALSDAYEVAAVVTQPDRPAGRGRSLRPSPVKEAALDRGIPVIHANRLRGNNAVLHELRQLEPSLIVVAAFGAILPPEVLDLPEKGCINLHASLLPRHRGAAPVAAAIRLGDPETGVTAMLMDAGLDTGPILTKVVCPIEDDDTTGSLTDKLGCHGADLLLDTLPNWIEGELSPCPQDEALATFAPPLSKSDGLLDWGQAADLLAREVRAYQPWPGSFTFWKGQRFKVIRAHSSEAAAPVELPGTVLLQGTLPAVTCGSGVLVLDQVQPAGKSVMAADAFTRGARDFVGSRLGDG